MEINEKDRAVIESLTALGADKDHSYDWPIEIQQRILGSLLTDRYFLLQCVNIIKPFYFQDKAHQKICKILYEFYNKYGKQPDRNILEMELVEQLADNPARHYYLAELEIVCQSYEPVVERRDYLLDKITEFAKTQALRSAYSQTLDILFKNQNDKWVKIRDILQTALLVERNVDLGMDYFQEVENRYLRMQQQVENRDYFSSGFPSIDAALGGGLSRGEIGAWCGMSGSGKSLALVKGAATNLLANRKVLYISLEMDEDKTSNRFDALFTHVPIMDLLQEHNHVIASLRDLAQFHTKSLFVKQFAAGSADVTTIRAYLSQLSLHGFQPDLVAVDYVGELRDLPGMKTYESRQRLVRDLRALAVENSICILTAMQVGRAGREAMEEGHIDDDALADSQGQVRPLDALWSLNQNKLESKAGVGKIYVIKHRNARGRFYTYYERNPATLDMNEITHEQFMTRLNLQQQKNSDSVDIEGMPSKVTRFKPNEADEEIG